jgi:hypothetical protein
MQFAYNGNEKKTKMTFKKYMQENYDNEQLIDISTFGCVSGCANGMIYYYETLEIYNKYADELHEIVSNITLEFGEFPKYILENFNSEATFKNAMVWLCAEYIAYELAN